MSDLSINQNVIAWARGRLGQQVGRGECWDLADQALRNAGAHSSNTTKANANYTWGQAIKLGDAIPGDVLQFLKYKVTTTTTTITKFADGTEEEESEVETIERPHHTALVERSPSNGWINILEQNVPPAGKRVQAFEMATRTMTVPPTSEYKSMKHPTTGMNAPATVITTASIQVSGTISVYRPEAVKK
jgi:hypothetical protein